MKYAALSNISNNLQNFVFSVRFLKLYGFFLLAFPLSGYSTSTHINSVVGH